MILKDIQLTLSIAIDAIMSNSVSNTLTPIDKISEAIENYHTKSDAELFGYEPFTILTLNKVNWITNVIEIKKYGQKSKSLITTGLVGPTNFF